MTLRLHDDLCPAKSNPPDPEQCRCASGRFELHMEVSKDGYPGVIVSVFRTLRSGHIRFVVESMSLGTEGSTDIFTAEQLRPRS